MKCPTGLYPELFKTFETVRWTIDDDAPRNAFPKVGLLVASSGRSGKPLHPTHPHVNKNLFPNDTVPGRLPDPSWLEHWLDLQLSFDRE